MENSQVQVKRGGPRPLPRPRNIAIGAMIFFAGYNIMYLLMWEHMPDYQMLLNRISWSMADAVAITGTAMGIYSYYLVFKAQKEADVAYLNEFVYELKRAGIEPSELGVFLRPVASAMNDIQNDQEFQNKLQSALERVSLERMEGLKRLNEDELYELLRSGGGKLF